MKVKQKFARFNAALLMLMIAAVLLLAACDSSDSQSSGDTAGDTGPISFSLAYHGDGAAGKSFPQAISLDCVSEGVVYIEACVYDQNNRLLRCGGPWDCVLESSGTISGVEAGDNRRVVVIGTDSGRNVVLRGENPDVDVVAGQYNSAGVIDCFTFVPTLQDPAEGTVVEAGAFTFSWDPVDGANSYGIRVSANSDMSNPVINDITTQTNYTSSDLSNGTTYYWQVRARDSQGNTSTWPDDISFDAHEWRSVASGEAHTVAITPGGTLWAWGDNGNGQLGLGHTTPQTSPQQVPVGSGWDAVAAGFNHTVAIKNNGELWAWGSNGFGQLGLGDTEDRSSPQQVQVESDNDWDAVAAGFHTLAIKNNGALWAWGSNGFGQLGLGDTEDRSSPQQVQVESDNDWDAVAAGHHHTVAIKNNGELWAWGLNDCGQLGFESTTPEKIESSPKQVGSDNDWDAVAAGGDNTVAIKNNGELYAWGRNNYGQLGLGETAIHFQYNSPQKVGSDNDWDAVAAGYFYMVAIKNNGELYAWGRNDDGQLGLGHTTSPQPSPQQIGSGWNAVAAGFYHTVAIKNNGELWAWGVNERGQLGFENPTPDQYKYNSPQKVGSD